MQKPELIKLKSNRQYFKCEMCLTTANTAVYQYKSYSYIKNYETAHLENVCKKCVYREIYGSKNYRKKMKEGTLDGQN